MFGIEIRGIKQVQGGLEGLRTVTLGNAGVGIALASRHLMGVAQQNAPFRTGALVNSARVHRVRIEGQTAVGGVSFDAKHAAKVHEGFNRKRKYLQKAIGTEAAMMLNLITVAAAGPMALQKAIKGGGTKTFIPDPPSAQRRAVQRRSKG